MGGRGSLVVPHPFGPWLDGREGCKSVLQSQAFLPHKYYISQLSYPLETLVTLGMASHYHLPLRQLMDLFGVPHVLSSFMASFK